MSKNCPRVLSGVSAFHGITVHKLVAIKKKHFYIHEPCQLAAGALVIPIFLYDHMGKINAKFVKPDTKGVPSDADFKMIIPHCLPYQCASLISIDCNEFSLDYSEICLWGGRTLLSATNSTIWGG